MSSVIVYSAIVKLIGMTALNTAAYYFFKFIDRELIGRLISYGGMAIMLVILYKLLKALYLFYFHKETWMFI